MKSRKPHIVPLSAFAVSILQAEMARQRDAEGAEPEFVFASRAAHRTQLARHSLSQAMRRVITGLVADGPDRDVIARLKSDPPTPHDLRRTCATGLSKLKIPREDRLAVLAHSYDDVHGVHYDQHDRLDEKRAALGAWERHLRKVIAGEPDGGAEIVNLRRAVAS